MISITNKQIISYLVWLFVIFTSTLFLLHSNHLVASLIIYAYNIIVSFWGIIYTYKNKQVILFNPIFQVIYCSIFYYSFMGLYCLSNINNIPLLMLPTNNEEFLIQTSAVLFLVLIIIVSPTIISNIFNRKIKFSIDYLFQNYDENKVCKYLYRVFPIIIFLYFLLCFTAGYTPVSAILNPAEFRNACSKDIANFVYVFYQPIFILSLCLTIQMSLLHKIKTKSFKIYLGCFILFCLFWGIFSGGRSWFVTYIVYFFIIYSFKPKIKINLFQILKVLCVVTFLIVFISIYGTYRIYRTQIANGGIILSSNKYSHLEKTLMRLDTYSAHQWFMYKIYKKNDSFISYNDFKLKDIIKTQLIQAIPRRFVPNKLDDTHGEITKYVFPEVYYSGTHILFGGIAALYYEGGLFWLFLNSLTFGFLVLLLNCNIKKYIKYDVFITFYQIIFLDGVTILFSHGVFNNAQSIKMPIKFILCCIVTYLITKRRRNINIKL